MAAKAARAAARAVARAVAKAESAAKVGLSFLGADVPASLRVQSSAAAAAERLMASKPAPEPVLRQRKLTKKEQEMTAEKYDEVEGIVGAVVRWQCAHEESSQTGFSARALRRLAKQLGVSTDVLEEMFEEQYACN